MMNSMQKEERRKGGLDWGKLAVDGQSSRIDKVSDLYLRCAYHFITRHQPFRFVRLELLARQSHLSVRFLYLRVFAINEIITSMSSNQVIST